MTGTSEDSYAEMRENLIEGDPIEVVDELLRLRKVEEALRDAIAWKRTQVAALTYQGPMWPGADNYQVQRWAKEAVLVSESADELERIAKGLKIT